MSDILLGKAPKDAQNSYHYESPAHPGLTRRVLIARGRSEQESEAYVFRHGEELSDMNTKMGRFSASASLTESGAVYYCGYRLGDRLAVGRQSLELTT